MALVYPYNNVRHKGDIYQQNDLILLQCILIVEVVYSSRKVQKHVTSRPHSSRLKPGGGLGDVRQASLTERKFCRSTMSRTTSRSAISLL